MERLISLKPSGLPVEFDAGIHGEEPVVTIEEKEDQVVVNFVFPAFSLTEVDQVIDGDTLPFQEIGISGAGYLSEDGKPLMPSFGRYVQIPPGFDVTLSVKKGQPVKFENFLITPAQENYTDGEGDDEFSFDSKAYVDDSYYPANIAELGEPQNLDNYRVVLLHVRPLQYNSSSKKLRGYSNITVCLSLKAQKELAEEDRDQYLMTDPESEREGFGNLVLNPRRRIVERVGYPMPAFPLPRPYKRRGPEFVIIYTPLFEKAALKLLQWKLSKGLRTEAVSIDVVGNTVSDIKTYIRNRRKFLASRLRYVLLFGDVDTIPTEQIGSTTTDHYYFTSRDATNTSECLLPWISGGRIPVTTRDEAENVVKQIIRYERNPPSDEEYYRKMTFGAFFQDDRPQDGRADRAYMKTMEGIRSHMISLGFDVERVYVSNNPNPQKYKDGTTIPTDVLNSIIPAADATQVLIDEATDGQLVVGHRDHGGPSGWVDPPFRISHVSMIGSTVPSIFYSVNCSTGRFDNNPSDCFAEAMLQFDGGAPSLIAATEDSGTWRNDSLIKGLFDSMWPGVLPVFPGTTASYGVRCNRLGDLLNYSKSFLLVAHGVNSGVKHHIEIYHVVGDPTLQVWAEAPRFLRMRAKVDRKYLRIKLGAVPAGATMTIWYKGKMLKRIEPKSSMITIPVRELLMANRPYLTIPSRRRGLSLCYSAPGWRFASVIVRL